MKGFRHYGRVALIVVALSMLSGFAFQSQITRRAETGRYLEYDTPEVEGPEFVPLSPHHDRVRRELRALSQVKVVKSKPAVKIARSASGRAERIRQQTTFGRAPGWKWILQGPGASFQGDKPGNWLVKSDGQVQVPASAVPGTYVVHYFSAAGREFYTYTTYRFEVVTERAKKR